MNPSSRFSSLRALFRLAAVAFLAASASAADLAALRLDTVFPPGGQIGAEVEVSLTGELEDAKTMQFSNPAITAEAKGKNFLVKVPAEVAPGIYDVRVAGPLGISNPRAFVVGTLPDAKGVKTSDKPATAAELPLNTVFSGSTTTAADTYLKFTATEKQRLLIECLSAELDSKLLPVLAVLDGSGKELESSSRGGLLDFIAPAAGSYLLRLHDLTYAGSPAHFYRLSISTGPHLDYVFPPSAPRGSKAKFTLYGRNLPGGAPARLNSLDNKPLEKLETEIDVPSASDGRVDGLLSSAAMTVEGFSYRLKTAQGTSNPVFISFASGPVVVENEGNSPADQAQKITLPCEIVGQFYPAADVDTFAFDAKKGEVWWIEVVSHRLGLSTNPFALVQRETEAVEGYGTEATVAEKKFAAASNDPSFRFEAKADGAYRVSVRDLFGGARRDPRNVYRLIMRPVSPDFRLAAVPEAATDKADERSATPRGATLRGPGTLGIKVYAARQDGFAGDIELSAEGLPAGVTCTPTRIPAGKNDGLLILAASEKPAQWLGSIRILGKATIANAEVTREARSGAVRWEVKDFNIDVVQARLARDFPLAVTDADPAPMSLLPAEEKTWEVAVGAKLEVPLKITRRGEFKDALKLKPAGPPALDAAKEQDVDAKAETATVTLDLATTKLPPGSHLIYFQALTKGKFHGKDATTTFYSPPIRVEVKAPEKAPDKK